MAVGGGVALGIGLAALGFVVAALVGGAPGTVAGYVCFGLVALVFGGSGVAMLAGSRVMPPDWPPRDD
ncbi:hypothetical protein GCM10022220_30550 [Actinocatenispora rupis]|uniref:Uncharacterized protein n=2 Tax=Actinocatenispora rupis TaxID=519421 RepID=A0A8J3IZZ0_9ACTN|nr:hypothetical protein Aru02nite_41150 [Actinocatenispora rupis]